MDTLTILAIALIAVGAGITSIGILGLLRSNAQPRADGVITGTPVKASAFAPLRGASFSYTAADGTEHSIWSPEGSGEAVGRAVQVRYDPTRPQDAQVAAPLARTFAFFAAGDALLLVGILILVL